MNIIVPLQIGARDVAFPFLNSLSFWFFIAGGMLLMVSLVIGNFSGAGWVGYPPLSDLQYNPDVGVDYWIWTLQVSGAGTLSLGDQLFGDDIKNALPRHDADENAALHLGCSYTVVLIVFAFPILTATSGLLTLDRVMGMHFFTADLGGNPMMYINFIWAWGHPEVYILILPSFGIFSEVVSTFSQKSSSAIPRWCGRWSSITFISFLVWLHHFFTMGAGANVNAFFGIMTMVISVPTGVKIFNWLFTMFEGRVQLTSPMFWFLGFVIIFTIGGMDGVLMSVAPVDFQVHNSLFLIAHFHSMAIGGVVFGLFAG